MSRNLATLAALAGMVFAADANAGSVLLNPYKLSAAAPAPAGGAVAAPVLTGSPTLVASWDFGDVSKITLNSGKVSQITGSDSTAYTLAQASAPAQPAVATVGGYQAARFDGAQVLKVASGLGRAASDVVTVVAVMENYGLGNYGTLFSLSSSNSNTSNYGRHRMHLNGMSRGYMYHQGDNSTNQISAREVEYNWGRHVVIGVGATNSNTQRIYNDGTTNTGSVTSQFTSVSGGFISTALGADQVADFLTNVYVWRVLVYNGALSSTNITEIAAWASANWGITSGATTGSATFTWVAPTDLVTSPAQDGYKLYWSLTPGGEDNSATISGTGTLTYTVSSLTSGTWYFHLRSTSGALESPSMPLGFKVIQ
jgi:hypothetical protein